MTNGKPEEDHFILMLREKVEKDKWRTSISTEVKF